MKTFICLLIVFLVHASEGNRRRSRSENDLDAEIDVAVIRKNVATCNDDTKHHKWNCQCLMYGLRKKNCANLLRHRVFSSYSNPSRSTCREHRLECKNGTDDQCCRSLVCHSELLNC
ncbi:hypothetical protein ACHWQZ_G019476 [Mnemiopsis leidyi]